MLKAVYFQSNERENKSKQQIIFASNLWLNLCAYFCWWNVVALSHVIKGKIVALTKWDRGKKANEWTKTKSSSFCFLYFLTKSMNLHESNLIKVSFQFVLVVCINTRVRSCKSFSSFAFFDVFNLFETKETREKRKIQWKFLIKWAHDRRSLRSLFLGCKILPFYDK